MTTKDGMPVGDLPGWHQVFTDDFNGTALDESKWSQYDATASSSDTLWVPEAVTVSNSMAHLRTYNSVPHGRWVSAGMSMAGALKRCYGRYEARFRVTKSLDVKYNFLHWPSYAAWPDAGEINWAEGYCANADQYTQMFIHYGDPPGHDTWLGGFAMPGDFTVWQRIAIEWLRGQIRWYHNGVLIRAVDSTHIPSSVMEMDVQCETVDSNNSGTVTPQPAVLDIDWVVAYMPV